MHIPTAGRAAVAASQPLAAQAGLEVLREGGTAADAAICMNAVLCLVEPTGAGLGGDLFALVFDPKARAVRALNSSGRSPAGAPAEAVRARAGGPRIPPLGGLAVSVPGCAAGWAALHARFGRLPWARLLAPAAALARAGFRLTPVIAREWARNAARLAAFPRFAEVFLPAGFTPAAGAHFRNPQLAETFELLARDGARALYEGEAARRIAAAVREAGGFLAAEDLAGHRALWSAPLSVRFRGLEVCTPPPNGQGLAFLQMLLMLPEPLPESGRTDPDVLHRLIEIKKLAFEDRARWIADPEVAGPPPRALLDPERQAARARAITARAATRPRPTLPLPDEAGPPPGVEAGGTVYLCAADPEGSFVSLIQSNFRGMGSGVVPEGLGFVLQNRGELFDLEPGRPNSYAPAKRPFHTIVPALALRAGRPELAFGVMGGDFQPQGLLQVLLGLTDFGLGLQEAGDVPRWRHEGSSQPTGERIADGGRVLLEPGFPGELAAALRARGHAAAFRGGGYGGYQAVRALPGGRVEAASESRKDGRALALPVS